MNNIPSGITCSWARHMLLISPQAPAPAVAHECAASVPAVASLLPTPRPAPGAQQIHFSALPRGTDSPSPATAGGPDEQAAAAAEAPAGGPSWRMPTETERPWDQPGDRSRLLAFYSDQYEVVRTLPGATLAHAP